MRIKYTILLFFMVCFSASANDISRVNTLKKNAAAAFQAGNYEEAAAQYSYLIDSLLIDDERVVMNLGHAYYQLDKKDLAQAQYQKLVLSKDESLKSIAYQQLGALSNDPKTLQKALSYFKESIKSDPGNQDARYNYELVKKKLKEQQDQNQDNQDQNKDQDQEQDQENKDQQDQDQQDQEQQDQDQQDQQNQDQEGQDQQDQEQQNKDQQEEEQSDEQKEEEQQQNDEGKEGKEEEQPKPQEGEEGEEGEEKDKKEAPQPSPSDKMQEMNISEEKAKMILEALKNSEIQYIQQNRRKPTKRKDSDKPDW
ncbi:MAG: hypothetical protein ABJF11_00685 [Reichenbachiella sp.]|uniref:hypothetical protein n=1 Tax=Reichenbachiella sp. TaxID=2184521 RepID=UPI003265A507